jgi:hypothetical protein
MGDGRWVMVVVVAAVQVYNNDFSISIVFITISGNKKTCLQARGRNAPEPIIVVIIAAAVAATDGSLAVAANSDARCAVVAGLVRG